MNRRIFLLLAVIAVCLTLNAYFLWRILKPAEPTLAIPGSELPMALPEETIPRSLFAQAPSLPVPEPDDDAVLAISAETPLRALVKDESGRIIWISPGDTFRGGLVVTITPDAVIWQGKGGTRLLQVVSGKPGNP